MNYTLRHATKEVIPYLEGHIKTALSKCPEYLYEDVVKDIEEGEAYLFSVDDGEEAVGAILVREEHWPQKSYLLIHLVGGKQLEEWIYIVEEFEELAKQGGFDGVISYCRPGWKKLLPDWRSDRVILIKDFGEAA